MERRCGNCSFYHLTYDLWDTKPGSLGECRHNAPAAPAVTRQGVRLNKWPEVAADDWCGDYKTSVDAEIEALKRPPKNAGQGSGW